jgi:hypothetical protein
LYIKIYLLPTHKKLHVKKVGTQETKAVRGKIRNELMQTNIDKNELQPKIRATQHSFYAITNTLYINYSLSVK